jgi:hypothetical protein
MYISIDRNLGRFMHKHPDFRVVCDLDYIINVAGQTDVGPIDSFDTFLRGWTDLELQMLYRNTTGLANVSFNGHQLKGVLAAIANKLPVSDAIAAEVHLQASWMEKNHPKEDGYFYVKGSWLPSHEPDLFYTGLKVNVSAGEVQDAARNATVLATQRAPRVPATQGSVPRARPSAAPSAPRTAGVRATIWKTADDIWAKHGSPKEKNAVLALRKRIMDILEADHAVKRTSSSNELGNWQKARVGQ